MAKGEVHQFKGTLLVIELVEITMLKYSLCFNMFWSSHTFQNAVDLRFVKDATTAMNTATYAFGAHFSISTRNLRPSPPRSPQVCHCLRCRKQDQDLSGFRVCAKTFVWHSSHEAQQYCSCQSGMPRNMNEKMRQCQQLRKPNRRAPKTVRGRRIARRNRALTRRSLRRPKRIRRKRKQSDMVT